MEDAKQKRLESQLKNVIDRSSTLLPLMIPGSKKKNNSRQQYNCELAGLLNDTQDFDNLLASLPPEYLASITANGAVDFDDEVEHESPIKEVSSRRTSPKRCSPSKSLMTKHITNGFKEADLPLKDSNGFSVIRLSLSPPAAKKARIDIDDDDDAANDTLQNNEILDEPMNQQPIQAQTSATSLHEEEMNDLAKVAESFRPTGSTYETAKVQTAVPSLIFARLRE